MEQCKFLIMPEIELYYDDKSLFGVYACRVIDEIEGTAELNRFGNITMVGTMPKFEIDKQYTVYVEEEYSSKYDEKQYRFIGIEKNEKRTKEDQKNFFKSILTELQYKNIFEVYDDPLTEILNDTFDYKKVKGIGAFTYQRIKSKVTQHFLLFDLIAELSQYGLTFKQIYALYEKYKNIEFIKQMIKDNPYVLMDLDGIGFVRADKIAAKFGIKKNDTRRIQACILYILEQQENQGHTWTDIKLIENKVKELTGEFDISVEKLISQNSKLILVDNYKVATRKAYNTEYDIAYELNRLQNGDILNCQENDIAEFIQYQNNIQGFSYNKEQEQAFYNLLKSNVNNIIGYAGSGKSITVNGILNFLDKQGVNYLLLSPTAKACKVLIDYTGREAFTIERGLGWTPDGYVYNEKNTLPYSVIIVDEASMIGIYKFLKLLKAVNTGSKLILIGDSAQLPSLESGNILHDIVKSNKFATTKLTEVHRQAKDSGIIELATRVRLGECFIRNNETNIKVYGKNNDACIIPGTKFDTVHNIVRSYKRLLEIGYSVDDIMVILPIKKGESRGYNLNKLLQEINNPPSKDKNEILYGKKVERIFREQDKVINIKNNYKKPHFDFNYDVLDNIGVINGDIGSIREIVVESDENFIAVVYSGEVVLYTESELDMLEHAYAFTVHKCQGSGYKAIIFGLDSRHFIMAYRSLVYTAFTRAKEKLIVCCEPYILNKAIQTDVSIQKRTFLYDLLC